MSEPQEEKRRRWRIRLPRPWQFRPPEVRAKASESLKGRARVLKDTFRPRPIERGVLQSALRGNDRPDYLGESEEAARQDFERLRLFSGILFLCAIVLLTSIFVASTGQTVVQAGAIAGLPLAFVLAVLCVRADWALLRLRRRQSVGLIEWFRFRMGGRRCKRDG